MRRVARTVFMAALLLAGAATANAGEIISSDEYGYRLTLPDDWRLITSRQLQDQLSKSKIPDEDLRQQLLKRKIESQFVAIKQPEQKHDVDVSLKLSAFPYRSAVKDPYEIAANLFEFHKRLVFDLKALAPPQEKRIGDVSALYQEFTSSLNTPDGRLPVLSKMWIIPRREFFFLIVASQRPDGKTGSADLAISAVESMEFTND